MATRRPPPLMLDLDKVEDIISEPEIPEKYAEVIHQLTTKNIPEIATILENLINVKVLATHVRQFTAKCHMSSVIYLLKK